MFREAEVYADILRMAAPGQGLAVYDERRSGKPVATRRRALDPYQSVGL